MADENVIPEAPSYFAQTMEELGIDPERYLVHQKWERNGEMLEEYHQVFESAPDGSILINYFDIEGRPKTYQKPNTKSFTRYQQKRCLPGTLNKKGDELRYILPKGGGTAPFIPPRIIEAYRNGTPITTLIITEGAKKAAKGDKEGLYIIGLPSITHSKSSDTKELHLDIQKLIKKCKVQRVVWLHDGDARRLTQTFPELKPDADLYNRPNTFYRTVWTVKNMLNDFVGLNIYYASIKSENVQGDPKGLDDLYIQLAENFPQPKRIEEIYGEIKRELESSSLACEYFHKFDVTTGMDEVRKWYCLDHVNSFYAHHEAKIKDREFYFNGTKYQWDGDKGHCQIIIRRETKDYVRVGTDYYKWVISVDAKLNKDRILVPWTSTAITQDFDKHFLNHIEKLDKFCNVPDHVDYHEVIHGNFNRYLPFKWTERPAGEWPHIQLLIKRIFGEEDVTYKSDITNKTKNIKSYELGYDYLQQLYKNPTHPLPILCPVSKERNTGKTTFGKLLKMIFAGNATWVGNADFANDFNASWASKLLVMCDEVLLEKQAIIEKLKSLTTADKMMMNSKGKDQGEVDFYAKFVLFSNNEDNFAKIEDEEVRFWVRKVAPLRKEDKIIGFDDKLMAEIPAFLNFLDKRKMCTLNEDRLYFQESLIVTDALKRVIERSQPTIQKEMVEKITQMFEMKEDQEEIMMTTSDISKQFFKGAKYEHDYIKQSCLKMGVEMYHKDGKKIVKRYDYPIIHEFFDNSDMTHKLSIIMKPGVGRPWVFRREDFVKEELTYESEVKTEAAKEKQLELETVDGPLPTKRDNDSDDLPF